MLRAVALIVVGLTQELCFVARPDLKVDLFPSEPNMASNHTQPTGQPKGRPTAHANARGRQQLPPPHNRTVGNLLSTKIKY